MAHVEEVRDSQLIRRLERKKRRKQNSEESWHIWQYWFFITRALAPAWYFFESELYRPEKAEEPVDLLGRWSSEHLAEIYGDLWDKFGHWSEYVQQMVAEDTRLWRQLWRRYVQANQKLVFDCIRRIFQ